MNGNGNGPTPAAVLVQVRGLTKYYRMGDSIVRALDGVDLEVRRGDFMAITGASGSGKSTLMHLVGCLDRPTGGQIIFNGRDVSGLSDKQLAEIRNRQIGFVFQTFNLMNRTTALDNVTVPTFYARKVGTRGPARAALERVGLAHRATHRSNELSGGERQRVAIARAIVNNPLLVLADEPTGNLDSRTGQQIMDLFRALNEQGATIILVTHEHDVAIQARRIVQMRDGKIVSDRPTEEVLRDGGLTHLQVRAALDAPDAARPPVADARPVAADGAPPEQALDASKLGPPRRFPGTTAGLVLGVLACVMPALAFGIGRLAARLSSFNPAGMTPEEAYQRMPKWLIFASLGAALVTLAGIVLGIVAIVNARRVGRRLRDEPGNWLGAGYLRIAFWLGWLALAGTVAMWFWPLVAKALR